MRLRICRRWHESAAPAQRQRVPRRQLAEEREADLQSRSALRARAAVRRSQRPDGEPRCVFGSVVGGTSQLRQRSVSAYLEDNWQKNAKLTFNLGLRYELALPYVEVNGRMANLDASSDLSSVAAVLPGTVGPFTGMFPAGLLNTDGNK